MNVDPAALREAIVEEIALQLRPFFEQLNRIAPTVDVLKKERDEALIRADVLEKMEDKNEQLQSSRHRDNQLKLNILTLLATFLAIVVTIAITRHWI